MHWFKYTGYHFAVHLHKTTHTHTCGCCKINSYGEIFSELDKPQSIKKKGMTKKETDGA